jgi:hypothetical protein
MYSVMYTINLFTYQVYIFGHLSNSFLIYYIFFRNGVAVSTKTEVHNTATRGIRMGEICGKQPPVLIRFFLFSLFRDPPSTGKRAGSATEKDEIRRRVNIVINIIIILLFLLL